MTWVLIIVSSIYGRGAGMVSVPGYPTAQSCLASATFAKQQTWTEDAYCIAQPTQFTKQQ